MQSAAAASESFGMNTGISYRVYGENSEQALSYAKSELSRLESMLSRFIQNSEISRINMLAGSGRVKINCETLEILSFALQLSEISQGLFDITVAPLMDLWDYKHSNRVPDNSKIRNAQEKVGFRDLVLDTVNITACLRKPGQSIDLGGIGKGYASDRCIKVLQDHGVTSAAVNIGGNVSTLGNKPDGSEWSVGIRHPRHAGALIGAVKVTGKAVVTSGDYERYFIDRKGKRRHHILDPTTGYPAESGLISVTVIADSAMTADALSTLIFVAGMEKGLRYLGCFPDTQAVLVDKRQRVFITRELKDRYKAVDGIKANFV
ncbi:MAG: Thiamine biosynthesis lipoprotein ApbE precursor [Firmicutes bacterium ADurb.Bin182]|nr:MAG: Thiamine biosynthesis lipoprotein ApbE precursor [Firmicutes bacterium ADurb.Bin182]